MTKWCGVLPAPQTPQKPPKVTLEITETGLAINGKDLELCLSLSSKHSAPRELSVHLIAQAMRYTGVPDCQVWSAVENVRLQPRQGESSITSYKSYENCTFYTLGLNKHTYDSKHKCPLMPQIHCLLYLCPPCQPYASSYFNFIYF